MQYNTIQYNKTRHCNGMRYNTSHYHAIWYIASPYKPIQRMPINPIHHIAMQDNAVYSRGNTVLYNTIQNMSTQYNTLQYIARQSI